MKKGTLVLFVIALFNIHLFSQITVYDNNKVGIGTTSQVNSKLSVNTTGSINWEAYIYNPSTANGQGALVARKEKPGNNSYRGYGIYGICYSGNGYAYGTRGYAYNSTPYSSGRSYGVWGYAGNATHGFNYGVYGILKGSHNGAGVFGTTSGDINTGGKYAGYFNGTTKVNGTLYVGSLIETSDSLSKKEIRDLERGNINKLKKLKVKKFKYKTPMEMGIINTEESDTASFTLSNEMTAYYEQDRIGLMAQDIQKDYPELVKTDQQGILGVDYIGLVAVLLEAINEQQEAIEDLENKVSKLANNGNNGNNGNGGNH